jgi:hypothetical protein
MALSTWLHDNLHKGFIKPSKLPAGALILYGPRRPATLGSATIEGYLQCIMPMTWLLHKEVTFSFDATAQATFDGLKTMFTCAPILAHYNPAQYTQLEVNALDGVTPGILSQKDPANCHFHPVH